LKAPPPPTWNMCFFVNWMNHMPFSSKPSNHCNKKKNLLLLCDLQGDLLYHVSVPLFYFFDICPQDYNPQNCLLWNVDILSLLFQCFVMENLNVWLCWYFFLQMRGNNTMHNKLWVALHRESYAIGN
jgi:hypothetical protein